MLIDSNLQALSGWQNHQGGSIGGVSPQLCVMSQGEYFSNGQNNAALFYIKGSTVNGQCADVDWYITRPVVPNTGLLILSYNLIIDTDVVKNAQALERDTVLTINKLTSNFSHQLLVVGGGNWKIQISDANNKWTDTGFSISPLTPYVAHSFVMTYAFDISNKVYSYKSIDIDSIPFNIPSNMQNLPMQSRGWGDGAIFQFQQDLIAQTTTTGLSYTETICNASFMWI